MSGRTQPAELPAELRPWVYQMVGEYVGCWHSSSKQDASRAWRILRSSGTSYFVKVLPNPAFFHREVFALRRVVSVLGQGQAPRLVAANAHLCAVVTTGLRGAVASTLSLSHTDEYALHRQAGQLIRRLHDATPTSALPKAPASTFIHHAVTTLEILLQRVSRLLSDDEEALIRKLAAVLAGPEMSQLPTAYCHGDNRPRNWSWHNSQKSVALLNFECCEKNLRLRDTVRLAYGPWIHRDDLREAYLDGYGQDLTDVERAALPAFAALDALNRLRFGHVALDTEAILRARVALAHLMEESSHA